jgi:4-hydroxybenzoate polyprenyltransferase
MPAACQALTLALLAGLGLLSRLGWPYWMGLAVVGGLLTWEHAIVRPNDLSRIDVAFFNVNSSISIPCL